MSPGNVATARAPCNKASHLPNATRVSVSTIRVDRPQLRFQRIMLNPAFEISGVGLTNLGKAQAAAQFPMPPHCRAPSRQPAFPTAGNVALSAWTGKSK